MNSNDSIAKAKTLPAGAVFHRCALQVNSHAYGGTFRGKPSGGDAGTYAQAIVDKAVEIGVSVLAITDHNDVSGVSAFQDAAADTLLQRAEPGDREKAMSLLDESLAISSELGMRPLMERVLSRREILRA